MPLRKPITTGTPAAPSPAARAPAPPGRKRWPVRVAVALVVGATVWGAWAALTPDPLRGARDALDRRDFVGATAILSKHLERDPNDPEARLLAARAARRDNEFGRAQEHLRLYAEKHAPNPAYELESNLLAAHSGGLARAEALFAEYSARPDAPEAPGAMEAYIEGTLKARLPYTGAQFDPERDDPAIITKLHRAVDQWLAHRSNTPDQVQGFTWRGRIHGYARDHEKSLAAFRQALALDPNHFDSRYYLAIALVQSAPEECLKHFDILLEQRPGNRFLRFLVATTRRRFGQFAGARRVLDDMLVSDQNDLAALVELALLNLDEGKFTAAEPLLQRALKLGPNVPEANLAMSRCQQLAGRPDEAARYRKRFEETDAERNRPRGQTPLPQP